MTHYGRVFKSFPIGRFTIIPEGESDSGIGGIPIILGKKGAFGSGEHETTAACLEELEKLSLSKRMTALDLGSGTGILAIAAARMGIESVVALDIDWKAAVSCMDNVVLNDMQGRITTVCGELSCLAAVSFDLIFANIYADIHLALAEQMVAMTKKNGMLILSGIPLQDKFDVMQCYLRAGCKQIDSDIGEDYATFVMAKS